MPLICAFATSHAYTFQEPETCDARRARSKANVERKAGRPAADTAAVDPMPKAGGKWNTYEITAKGDHLVVVLNGQKTVDVHDGKHARGFIALQYSVGNKKDSGLPIKFRNVQVRAL